MVTSMPASASSPASISPVGPPPAMITSCSLFAAPIVALRSRWIGRAFYGISGVLKQAPCALHIRVGDGLPVFGCLRAIAGPDRSLAFTRSLFARAVLDDLDDARQ